MSRDLEGFLSGKREGGKFDSHGTFTLNQDAIAAKLAEYGLGTQSACLTRLIQMGIVAGAREINILFGVEAVEIVMETDLPDSAFYADLDRPLRVLLSGCIHAGFRRVLVGSGPRRWKVDARFDWQQTTGPFRPGVAFVFSGPYDSTVRGDLSSRLRASPARVTIDSKPANDTFLSGRCLLELELRSQNGPFIESLWVHKECPSYSDEFLELGSRSRAVRYTDHGDGFLMEDRLKDSWELLLYARRTIPTVGENGKNDEPNTVALLRIPLKSRSASGLSFVKHGLVVGRVRTPLELEGYVSAAGLNTDLSGLKLVDNKKLRQRLEFLQSQVRALQPILRRPGLWSLRERLVDLGGDDSG